MKPLRFKNVDQMPFVDIRDGREQRRMDNYIVPTLNLALNENQAIA